MMTAETVNQIKAKIKAELLRRNGHGSVASYADVSYDFLTIPATDNWVLTEQGQKTVNLLLKIEDYGNLFRSEKSSYIPSDFTESLLTELDRLSKETKTGLSTEVSSCRGDCTGLCISSCISQCNGCSGCTASCGTGCTTGCYSNCTGSCNTNCTSGCFSQCTGATKTTGK